MSTQGRRGRSKRPKKDVVLIFGEDQNDTESIKELLLAACPSLEGIVKPMRRPPVLIRDCRLAEVADRAATVVDVIEAERATANVMAILAHEDCDKIEPAHEALSRKIEDSFQHSGYEVHAVTPAWELET